jgi:hypothetical protein
VESEVERKRLCSSAIEGEDDMAKQGLKRPTGGEMKAHTAGRVTNAGADFEELGSQGFNLR